MKQRNKAISPSRSRRKRGSVSLIIEIIGFLPPSLELESMKRGPARTLQYGVFEGLIKIERDKNRKIDISGDNINRKNKDGLSSGGASRSESAKCGTDMVPFG